MLGFLAENWVWVLIAVIRAVIWLMGRVHKNLQKGFEEARRQAEEDKSKQPRAEIKVGSKVTLDSGIYGVIQSIREKTFLIEIAPGVVIEVEKYGVIFVRDV